jgi:LPS sulfotransferase NodH
MATRDACLICTSPRSGSTLLCKLLAATGVAGRPASYFHRPSVEDWMQGLGIVPDATATERERLDAVFRAAIEKGRNATGVFGLRLQADSLAFFLEKLAVHRPDRATDRDRIDAAFGRTLFVHLRRLDKVEQAVSCLKAEQTGLWHVAPDGTELERTAPHRQPVYDRQRIDARIDTLTAHDRDWQAWFDREGIQPVRIIYEEFSADPVETLRGLLASLGIDRSFAAGVTPGVKKLADDTSREWAMRYRAGWSVPRP